ncbi:MAG TPA: DHH family phosphoesterase, partial [Candidatus Saccharimonadales bacterium]
MYDKAIELIGVAKKIVVIQGENPDGDSLGSSLAIEEILGDQGKAVSLYCATDVPKYMRYIKGWDRVESTFPTDADMAIIVDTSADILVSKALETPGVRSFLETHPVLVIDHHTTESNLSFPHTMLAEEAVATGEILYRLATVADWRINEQAAEDMLIAVMS